MDWISLTIHNRSSDSTVVAVIKLLLSNLFVGVLLLTRQECDTNLIANYSARIRFVSVIASVIVAFEVRLLDSVRVRLNLRKHIKTIIFLVFWRWWSISTSSTIKTLPLASFTVPESEPSSLSTKLCPSSSSAGFKTTGNLLVVRIHDAFTTVWIWRVVVVAHLPGYPAS